MMKKLIPLILLIPSLAFPATYAVTITGTIGLSGEINGDGTNACLNIAAGSSATISNMTLANCKDDAINFAESASMTASAVWCSADADCDITIATGKTLTGTYNAWRVAPAGAGTNSTTNNLTALSVCPYVSCTGTWDARAKKGSVLLDTYAGGTFTDERNRTGNDVGYWQHITGIVKVAKKYLKIYSP